MTDLQKSMSPCCNSASQREEDSEAIEKTPYAWTLKELPLSMTIDQPILANPGSMDNTDLKDIEKDLVNYENQRLYDLVGQNADKRDYIACYTIDGQAVTDAGKTMLCFFEEHVDVSKMEILAFIGVREMLKVFRNVTRIMASPGSEEMNKRVVYWRPELNFIKKTEIRDYQKGDKYLLMKICEMEDFFMTISSKCKKYTIYKYDAVNRRSFECRNDGDVSVPTDMLAGSQG